ncbi:hypothetical protein OPV22_030540 [Ensete ventricosum]|uniref:Uncharacterized protein n=1 Tax=Ensete ventricosum TaxID=4639 RepID=A0AAV8QEA4_ENSVE|nr:hypothetical protein OPV22_030540 [Ensete ventricosum]
MSRCLPYPPPFLEESLIESIKAKKEEREKAKEVEQRKAKKEKKEKRREEKRRVKVEQKPRNPRHEGKRSHKKRKHEERRPSEQKDQYSQRTKNDAIEQLEGSGLTEEHELLSSIGDKYDASPESSQDSNKRRKLVSSSISGHNKHGNILRIKLPLPSASSSQVDLEPSSRPPAMQTAGQVVVTKSNEMVHEQQPSVSGRYAEAHLSSYVERRIRRRTGQRGQFEDLIVNWNPPLSQLEYLDVGDEWWHFGDPKRRSTLCGNECEAITVGGSSCGDHRRIYLQQPRACYLPEFDVYQLPYVVPF